MSEECNVGRGMVDLLPQPEEDDIGEEWGKRERERKEGEREKERWRARVMDGLRRGKEVRVLY